jgi:DUF917 family protein
MGKMVLDSRLAEAVVLGGAVLGGGGGGDMADGLERAMLAVKMGTPTLISLDEIDDEDLVFTASVVGAPAAEDKFVRPIDHVQSTQIMLDTRPAELAGVIPNENGPSSGTNGWLQSAVLDIPVVDAPANGRAHPTGLMGAMGLHRVEGFHSIQTAVGGSPETGRYIEMVAQGNIRVTANMVRYASIQAGGVVAVSRDPVSADYLRTHAAPGATVMAIRIGEAMMAARDKGADALISAIESELGAKRTCEGAVTELRLETVGGYDVGVIEIEGDRRCELTFWNEFMTLEEEGRRLASFPDLITVVSLETGLPLASAELKRKDRVAVLAVPKENLILGEGVRLSETLAEAEKAIGRSLGTD